MLVRPKNDSSLVATPVSPPPDLKPFSPMAPLDRCKINFAVFEDRVKWIQAAKAKQSKKLDDSVKYEQWLHAYTVMNDGQAPQRMGWTICPIEAQKGVIKRLKKVWVLKERVCKLEPSESWGTESKCGQDNCPRTIEKYEDRAQRSLKMRKRKQVGHLTLVHSQPKYPDAFTQGNNEPSRAVTWADMYIEAADGMLGIDPDPPVGAAEKKPNIEVMGPPEPPVLFDVVEETVTTMLDDLERIELVFGCSNDYIAKVSMMKRFGHAQSPLPTGWVKKAFSRNVDMSHMYCGQDGYPSAVYPTQFGAWEIGINNPSYTTALACPDYARKGMKARDDMLCPEYETSEEEWLYMHQEQGYTTEPVLGEPPCTVNWRWYNPPRTDSPLLSLVTGAPQLNDEARLERWFFERDWGKVEESAKSVEVVEPVHEDSNEAKYANAQFRLVTKQYEVGNIDQAQYLSTFDRLRPVSSSLEASRKYPLLLVDQKPVEHYDSFERMLFIRHNFTVNDINTYLEMRDIVESEVEELDFEVEIPDDLPSVMLDHMVCREEGDNIEALSGEVILKDEMPPGTSVSTAGLPFKGFVQLKSSGVYVPKSVFGITSYETSKELYHEYCSEAG